MDIFRESFLIHVYEHHRERSAALQVMMRVELTKLCLQGAKRH